MHARGLVFAIAVIAGQNQRVLVAAMIQDTTDQPIDQRQRGLNRDIEALVCCQIRQIGFVGNQIGGLRQRSQTCARRLRRDQRQLVIIQSRPQQRMADVPAERRTALELRQTTHPSPACIAAQVPAVWRKRRCATTSR